MLGTLAKAAAKAAAPLVVDAASSFVKNKIAGAGRKRKVGRPKTVKPKAPKRAPKKAPAKRKTTAKKVGRPRGRSLRPAGY